MKEGRASQTAELVCMARAVAHAAQLVPQFNDPTAMLLLPEEGRQRVEGFFSHDTPKGFRAAFRHQHLDRLAKLMVARTVAIDEFVRRGPVEQIVILGAGLDGRAWRMPELSESIVFEVDHPDSQRDKRARFGALTQTAREVRFVSVDFVRQKLDVALSAAGHDPQQPTAWIWEGVVMYLTPPQIDALTLSEIAVLLSDGKPEVMAFEDIDAERRRWASLSAAERMDEVLAKQ